MGDGLESSRVVDPDTSTLSLQMVSLISMNKSRETSGRPRLTDLEAEKEAYGNWGKLNGCEPAGESKDTCS